MNLKSMILSSFVVATSIAFSAPFELLLECERFADKGGWVVDAQFMDKMGSPYLLAHGLGNPVADASTSFTLKEDGEYHIFARTKNWTGFWSEAAAGVFSLSVDGKRVGGELGTGSPNWRWVEAGRVSLNAGEHRIVLHDLTGFDGRCDAVCITKGSVPREGATRDADAARSVVKADLVVCGGGIAGICR